MCGYSSLLIPALPAGFCTLPEFALTMIKAVCKGTTFSWQNLAISATGLRVRRPFQVDQTELALVCHEAAIAPLAKAYGRWTTKTAAAIIRITAAVVEAALESLIIEQA